MPGRAGRATLVEKVGEGLTRLVQAAADKGVGDLPTTAELGRRFSASRPVVREAISRLELQGLIEVRHGVGLRVCNQLHRPVAASLALLLPDAEERLRQTLAARLLVEVEIARLAAQRITDSALTELVAVQERLLSAGPGDEAVEADLRFHRILAETCGNPVLALMLDSVTECGRQSRKRTIARAGVQRAYTTHQAILAALRRHDGGQAAAAMRRHLRIAMEDLAEQPVNLRRLTGSRRKPPRRAVGRSQRGHGTTVA